jgi:NAD(P)-dependent dehydrogenase (short-subunit alcohol dehydrogenase family)
MKLAGRVALAAGADSGIGQAIAVTFACEGADVAVHYGHDRQGAEETARQVRAQGRRGAARRCYKPTWPTRALRHSSSPRELGRDSALTFLTCCSA